MIAGGIPEDVRIYFGGHGTWIVCCCNLFLVVVKHFQVGGNSMTILEDESISNHQSSSPQEKHMDKVGR